MSNARKDENSAARDARESTMMDVYLVPVPRGLHHVVVEMLQEQLNDCRLTIQMIGESVDDSHLLHDLPLRSNPGSVYHDGVERHVSVGHHGADRRVWCLPGVWEGTVWLRILTTAAPKRIADIQCLGPLLACVKTWEHVHLQNDLAQVVGDIRELLDLGYSACFEAAVDLWKLHALTSWPVSDEQRQVIQADAIKIRASCTRGHSKKLFSYSREDFIKGIVDDVVPAKFKWTVDLNNYHMEVVILVISPTTLAIALALRPYQLLGANCFQKNSLPPDVSSPYMSGGTLSGILRLRPTTAHILLHLANIQTGDIVLDPCVGIGTIPLQISRNAVGLGGDLVLTPAGLAGVASDYIKKHDRHVQKSANLIGWDAGWLPLRSSSIDVIVSDLPFGQTCLSSAKLSTLLPLVLGEMSRVLRPDTGRVVLLCGAFAGIIQALETLNRVSPNNWILPCESVFPVNIGGIIAWVVMARRGSGNGTRVQNHQERVQKMTAKRDHIDRQRQGDQGIDKQGSHNKRFRLQA